MTERAGCRRIIYPEVDARLEYVGQFDEGLRNGTGVLLWKDGTEYAGEWLNDTQTGFGCMSFSPRDPHKRLRYEGEWYGGERHGMGTLLFQNNAKYVGEWKNDHYHGHGELTWAEWVGDVQYECRYCGQWKNGRRHGIGKFTASRISEPNRGFEIVMDGEWKDDILMNTDSITNFDNLSNFLSFVDNAARSCKQKNTGFEEMTNFLLRV